MSKNIRDFIASNTNNSQGTGINGASEDNIRRNVSQYSNLSEGELMSEMMRVASQSKADGTLNEESLKQFYNQAAPMLSEQQRNRLKQLINNLR